MSEGNVTDVSVNLTDVFGNTITDKVKMLFYYKDSPSLDKVANLNFQGNPQIIKNVPAYPPGIARVVIQPTTYRPKMFFKNFISGQTNTIDEVFLISPQKAKPKLIDFADISAKSYGAELSRILSNSNIDGNVWNNLDKRNRATILNLSAKMFSEKIQNGQPIIELVQSIEPELLTSRNRARVYARVDADLINKLGNFSRRFNPASGISHRFPSGWHPFDDNSFKSRDEAANIQFTFATNNDGLLLADIDLDDNSGIKHALDVIHHALTDTDTDPFNIHQILIHTQQLNPEYLLI